jgi:hypothetical protein
MENQAETKSDIAGGRLGGSIVGGEARRRSPRGTEQTSDHLYIRLPTLSQGGAESRLGAFESRPCADGS